MGPGKVGGGPNPDQKGRLSRSATLTDVFGKTEFRNPKYAFILIFIFILNPIH